MDEKDAYLKILETDLAALERQLSILQGRIAIKRKQIEDYKNKGVK